jgi:hypothetical protein
MNQLDGITPEESFVSGVYMGVVDTGVPVWVEDAGRLLRGELAAIEAYDQVMEKFRSDPAAKRLEAFRSEHDRAAKFWRDEILAKGLAPDEGSGPWGQWVFTVVGTAKLFGETSALQALRRGEQHGLSEYRSFLKREDVPERLKRKLKEDFIPFQERHIASLEVIQQIM